MTYEDFKALVCEIAGEGARQGGLVPIPELWGQCAEHLSRSDFEEYLTRLAAEGLVHLMSHVDTSSLTESTRARCVRHESGLVLYWVRWL